MKTRLRWLFPLLAVLAMVAAACGQKPGVHDASADKLPEIIIETGSGDGDVIEEGSSGGGGGGGGGQATSGGGGGGEESAEEGSGGNGGGGGGSFTVSGSDRTGVADNSLTLAFHAPVTGAAPLPSASFEKARDLYWRYVTETQGQTVLGRSQVTVDFKDDKYAPNTAIQACRELSSSAFLLVGGGGTDQIQACGQFSEQAGVPYLSAGVTEAGLRGLNYYFATSMSYAQQGPLLAAYVKKNFSGQKVAAIVTDTPNFDDAVAGWEDGVASQGLDYYKTLRHPKGNTSWITSFISELKGEGVDVVFMLTAPTDYLQFAQQASGQEYSPQYVGVGISMGLNAVLNSGCPHVDDGIFFSPFPGLDYARQNIPEYIQAGRDFSVATDDIGLALWGQNEMIHQMLLRYESTYGTDLTREDFVAMLAQQEGLQAKTYPQLSYSPDDHFGSSQVHVLQADCSLDGGNGEYVTVASFASGF